MTQKLYHNNQLISDEIMIADSFFKRLRGYMFYKSPPVKTLAIMPCNSIHTFFMKFNIDVLFLDEDMVVVKKYEQLKKNKLIKPIKDAKYVVESFEGGFASVSIGDTMSVRDDA